MELTPSTFNNIEEIDKEITDTGIYYVSISIYVIREKIVKGSKAKVRVFSFSGNYVFSKKAKERAYKKVLEDSGVAVELNKKTSNKPDFRKEIKVIKYLGEVSKQVLDPQWQKKKSIKENTDSISIMLPPTTSSVSTSLHRSMSIEDL